ncbi:MAG: glycosyltransferase [Candidatus Thorarchaeota archaeon]
MNRPIPANQVVGVRCRKPFSPVGLKTGLIPMIKVAMISPLPPEKSGEAPYAARLIKSLVGTNKASIIAIAGESAAPMDSSDSKIETLSIWKGRSLLYPFHLLKQITKRRCHVAHVQFGPYGKVYGGFFGEVMLFLLILLRMAGVKTTMTLHSTWMPWQVVDRVRKYRIIGRLSILAAPVFRLFMKFLNWGTSTIQLSTVKESSLLRKAFLKEYGFSPDKVLEIPHPCMATEEKPDRQSAASSIGMEGKKVILTFGYIRSGKGIEIALRAIAQLKEKYPDIVLLVAGRPQGFRGDEYLKDLQSLAKDLDITNNVRFDIRFIPREEVPTYFSASTILLSPYTESVGASGPIHNYAGFGVPIVASDVGFHNRESLGGNLFLFKSGDPNSLVRTLTDVLIDPNALDEIIQRQIQYAKQETWSLAAKRTVRHYRKTLR